MEYVTDMIQSGDICAAPLKSSLLAACDAKAWWGGWVGGGKTAFPPTQQGRNEDWSTFQDRILTGRNGLSLKYSLI